MEQRGRVVNPMLGFLKRDAEAQAVFLQELAGSPVHAF